MTDIIEKLARSLKPFWQHTQNDVIGDAMAEITNLRAERDAAHDDLRAMWAADQSSLRVCEHCDAWLTADEAARVEDISLCPREAYGGIKFPNERCFKHRAWLILEDRTTSALLATEHSTPGDES